MQRFISVVILASAVAEAFRPAGHSRPRAGAAAAGRGPRTTLRAEPEEATLDNAPVFREDGRVTLGAVAFRARPAGDAWTTTVDPGIFQAGAHWTWLYRSRDGAPALLERWAVAGGALPTPPAGPATALPQLVTLELAQWAVAAAAEGAEGADDGSLGAALVAAAEATRGFTAHVRVELSLADAIEAHSDRDDEPHWDYRSFKAREAVGAWAAAPNYDCVYAFEEKFNLLQVPLAGDGNFKVTASPCVAVPALGAAGAAGVGCAAFRTERLDAEEWVRAGDRQTHWCTHREWRDTNAWYATGDGPGGGGALAAGHPAGHPAGLAGVALFKDFKGPRAQYASFELADWSGRRAS